MGVGVGVWVGQRSSNERGVWGQKQNQGIEWWLLLEREETKVLKYWTIPLLWHNNFLYDFFIKCEILYFWKFI